MNKNGFKLPTISMDGRMIEILEIDYILEGTRYGASYDLKLNFTSSKAFTFKEFVKKVYFNEPYTIVIWNDGTKTIVKCAEGCKYDKYTGLVTCFLNKLMGNYGFSQFKKLARDFIEEN